MNKTVVIGLTGPTGVGKSAVARRLEAVGWTVVDADVLARRVVEPGEAALAALVERFSEAILSPDGALDRAALARIAFASADATAALNAIVHPAVIARMKDELEAARARGVQAVVLDVPLLFQAGLETLCDITVAVTAPEAVRLERICRRDALSEDAATARMNAQPPAEYYTSRADRVIDNGGDETVLDAAVAALIREVAR